MVALSSVRGVFRVRFLGRKVGRGRDSRARILAAAHAKTLGLTSADPAESSSLRKGSPWIDVTVS